MDVSVRELRNHTARVIAAVEAGERVVLTVHGRAVADIVPRQVRTERMPTDQVRAMLERISQRSRELDVQPDEVAEHDLGLTTDDMIDDRLSD